MIHCERQNSVIALEARSRSCIYIVDNFTSLKSSVLLLFGITSSVRQTDPNMPAVHFPEKPWSCWGVWALCRCKRKPRISTHWHLESYAPRSHMSSGARLTGNTARFPVKGLFLSSPRLERTSGGPDPCQSTVGSTCLITWWHIECDACMSALTTIHFKFAF